LSLTDDLVHVNRKICRLRPVAQAQQTAQEKKTAQTIQQEVAREFGAGWEPRVSQAWTIRREVNRSA
jgi:hypothetical protein